MLFTSTSFAGAGLAGNPSDGYFGKTLALALRNFQVDITMYETPEIQILPADVDDAVFANLHTLADDVERYGYYGGIRLLKSAVKVFADHCREEGIRLPERNFTARYQSNMPRRVGLGETSAVCTAMMKALVRFYEVPVPPEALPTLCWRAEHDELGVPCGFQDRVVQVLGGTVFMDLDEDHFRRESRGRYSTLPSELLPPLFLSYKSSTRKFSGDYHRRLNVLYAEKQSQIMEAMSEFADLAQAAADKLASNQPDELARLMDENFDLRNKLFDLDEATVKAVRTVRDLGGSAKLAGGSGSLIGVFHDQKMLGRLQTQLGQMGYTTVKAVPDCPGITAGEGEL